MAKGIKVLILGSRQEILMKCVKDKTRPVAGHVMAKVVKEKGWQ